MFYNFAKRLWQRKSIRRSNRRPRVMRLSLEHLEDRLVPAMVINPIFDSSITNDPNAAKIEGTINTAIQNVESSFSNPITVSIKFQEGSSGLGSSYTPYVGDVAYSSLRTQLAATATTSYAQTAVASLPTTSDNPVNGNADVFLTLPNARALGYSGANPPSGVPDGIITLNTSICNLDRTSINPSKYDLQSVAAHEIDEVLGFGSELNGSANGAAAPTGPVALDDLWRYDQYGNRSFNTTLANQAYFSIDGGHTDLARFNQQQGGDFSDWFSPGGQTPQVQDAFGTPGATPNLGVELIRLNVDGYTPAALAAPTGLTATSVSTSEIDLRWNPVSGATSYTLEWSTNGSTWNNLTTTSVTSYTDTGLQAGTHYYFQVVANNALESSAPSLTTSAVTLISLTARPVSGNQINLSWTPESGASNYVIERSTNSTSGFVPIYTASAGVTTYNDTNVVSGTTYYYEVVTVDDHSNIANALTIPATPILTATTGATASNLSSGQIILNWSSVTGASYYTLQILENGNWATIATFDGTSFADVWLQTDTPYSYRVLAGNSSGVSPFSNTASAVSSMTANEKYVEALYQKVLNRSGAKSELDGWVNVVPPSGWTWQTYVSYSFVHSSEHYTDLVNGMYENYLGRAADPGGFNTWYNALAGGQTFESVLSQFLASTEFYNDVGGNNTAFVEALYQDLLKRPADSGGLGYFVGQLNAGVSRQTVVYEFINPSVSAPGSASTEFRTDVVEALYGQGGPGAYWFTPANGGFLNRSGSSGDVSNWVKSGEDFLALEVSFAASSEFYNDSQNM